MKVLKRGYKNHTDNLKLKYLKSDSYQCVAAVAKKILIFKQGNIISIKGNFNILLPQIFQNELKSD